MSKLLTPFEVDQVLRYPLGKSERLARRGQLPHILLPDGEIRFDEDDVASLVGACRKAVTDKTPSRGRGGGQ